MLSIFNKYFLQKNKEKHIYCPICSSNKIKILGKNPDFDKCDIVICSKCKFMFTINYDGVDFYQYYQSEYRDTRKEIASPEYIVSQNLRAEAQKDFILQYAKNIMGAKVLEIGCSCGSMLKTLENYSCDLTGFEPDTAMFEVARTRLPNATLYNNIFKCNELKSQEYDIILLSHVLEHISNLKEVLEEFSRLLKPNGLLFLEIPTENTKKVIYNLKNLHGLGHLWFFNKKNITVLLKKYFKKIHVESFGISINELLDKRQNNLKYKLFSKLNIYNKQNFFDYRLKNKKGIYLRVCCRKKG